MEQNIQPQQPQQPPTSTPLGEESKIKSFFSFLHRHKIISIILCLFLIFIFSLLFYFLFIPNIKVSETVNNKYDIAIKNDRYQVIFTDPQYVYPYYSVVENEFGNKIILVRNDIPKSMQNFLMIRGAYYFYFNGIGNNLIREILSDISGFIRYPIGFSNLVVSKLSNNQYGYSQEKKDETQQKALTENQLVDVNLIGEIVERIENSFRIILIDPKTFKINVENNNQKQSWVYFKNFNDPRVNFTKAKLFDINNKPVEASYFDDKGIADGKFVIKVIGKKRPENSTVYAQEIHQTSWMTQFTYYGISLLYPSHWRPGFHSDGYSGPPYTPTEYVDESLVKTVKLGENSSRQDITGGFFSVSIIESYNDLPEAAHTYGSGYRGPNAYYPYGQNPQFKQTTVAGADAVLILPSDDQTSEFYPKGTRAAVIKYPSPLKIEVQCGEWECKPGQITYTKSFDYIVISADKDNFQTILDSVEFIH